MMEFVDKRKLRYLRMFILLFLWGICAFFVVWLTIDYFNEGRKNTVDIETYQIDKLRTPWIFTPLYFGSDCHVVMDGCTFSTNNAGRREPKTVDCSNAVYTDSSFTLPGILVNSTMIHEQGIGYTNPMDYLNLSFSIRHNGNDSLVDADAHIPTVCGSQKRESSTFIAVMADDVIMESLNSGRTINERDMGSPVTIGLGGIAAISYKLSQHEFLNQTIKNTTEFVSTQFRDLPGNQLEVRVIPQTFGVTKIIQKEGQSFIDLLGSIFGWIGIFTGACIFSVLETAIVAYEDREKEKNAKDRETSELLMVDSGMGEMNEMILLELRNEIKALKAEVDLLRHPASVPVSNPPTPPVPPPVLATRSLTGISGSRTPPPHRYASQRSVMSI